MTNFTYFEKITLTKQSNISKKLFVKKPIIWSTIIAENEIAGNFRTMNYPKKLGGWSETVNNN